MDSYKISSGLSSKILTIGPDYRNHRGGVGAVIEVYSRYFEVFNFIDSYRVGSAFYKSYIFFLCLIKIFFTLVTNRRIRIVHIHGSIKGSFYRKFIVFLICKYIFRKKIIYHIHGGGFNFFYQKSNTLIKRLIKTLLGKADIVISLSQSWMEYYDKNFKTNKLIVLPNIIDYPSKTDDNTKTVPITFLFLGLICEAKGIFDLIEVIANNKERYKGKIKLLIGGNGEVQHLKDLIGQNQIEDIVEFLGWVSNNGKADVLNRSDVYILPSYHEGLPISILESMSYGLAIIATNVGGIPEIVRNKENGLLINPGDHEQMMKAIDWFLENPELTDAYGANSIQIVQRHLPYKVMKELADIYTSLLSDK